MSGLTTTMTAVPKWENADAMLRRTLTKRPGSHGTVFVPRVGCQTAFLIYRSGIRNRRKLLQTKNRRLF